MNAEKIMNEEMIMSNEEIIARFSEGDLPKAYDRIWEALLKNYDLETKILDILRTRGFSVRINREQNFGWLDQSIFVNEKQVCCVWSTEYKIKIN